MEAATSGDSGMGAGRHLPSNMDLSGDIPGLLARLITGLRKLAFALGLVASTAAGCRDQAPVPAGPTTVVAPPDASFRADLAPTAEPSAAPVPFVSEKVTGEGHAMGTHLAFAAFTTPAIGGARAHALFDDATAEIERLERLMTT